MRTPAKTNLYLTVGDARKCDGRHEIRTLFVPLWNLCDEVSVERAPANRDLSIECTGRVIDGVASDDNNLAVRAARKFCSAYALAPSYHISLRKNIPISAGLGGGSSDAAAVLLELRRLTGFPSRLDDLRSIALELGADVPFFLQPTPSLATGIGEKLTPVEISAKYDVVIVYPAFPAPVSWAYQHWFRPENAMPPAWEELPSAFNDTDSLAKILWNDLEFALLKKFPLLEMIIETMHSCDGVLNAIVSGSGSSCIAFCQPDTASAVRTQLREKLSSYLEIL